MGYTPDVARGFYTKSVYEGLPNPSNPNSSNQNNVARADLPVTYREADLHVTGLTVPSETPSSGNTITVGWSVSNLGNRATRVGSWTDNVFLSRDGTLGPEDFLIGSFVHEGALAIGGAYNAQHSVRLPDSIDGDFFVIVETDRSLDVSSASLCRLRESSALAITSPSSRVKETTPPPGL